METNHLESKKKRIKFFNGFTIAIVSGICGPVVIPLMINQNQKALNKKYNVFVWMMLLIILGIVTYEMISGYNFDGRILAVIYSTIAYCLYYFFQKKEISQKHLNKEIREASYLDNLIIGVLSAGISFGIIVGIAYIIAT